MRDLYINFSHTIQEMGGKGKECTLDMRNKHIPTMILHGKKIRLLAPIKLLHIAPFLAPRSIQQCMTQLGREA